MIESNRYGTLYGVGVGPGNPEWLTLQAVRILGSCKTIFAPRARIKKDSLALEIVKPHLVPDACIQELTFPMSKSAHVLDEAWQVAANEVEAVLRRGEDACFVTIGDCMLYSTYLYLRRILEARLPGLNCVGIPGIPAFVAAASLAGIALGEGRKPLVIVPASGEISRVEWALQSGGTVVVMKVGERLPELQETLRKHNADLSAVLASKVGLPQQSLISLDGRTSIEIEKAYLSLALVPAPDDGENLLREDP
jgi:precorrin-2/cobalt-factor-2 C20-methyltransferase